MAPEAKTRSAMSLTYGRQNSGANPAAQGLRGDPSGDPPGVWGCARELKGSGSGMRAKHPTAALTCNKGVFKQDQEQAAPDLAQVLESQVARLQSRCMKKGPGQSSLWGPSRPCNTPLAALLGSR